jgi:BMFP domain-containing protein YqiC
MGVFSNIKAAGDMMKNMTPTERQNMIEQAQEVQKMLDKQIKKTVEEEIAKRNLVSREEVEKMLRK